MSHLVTSVSTQTSTVSAELNRFAKSPLCPRVLVTEADSALLNANYGMLGDRQMIWGPIHDFDSDSSGSLQLDRLVLLGITTDQPSSRVRWRSDARPDRARRTKQRKCWLERRILRHRRVFNGYEDRVFAGLVVTNIATCVGLVVFANLIA